MSGHVIEFDDGNESELADHRISAAEVTQLLLNEPAWAPNKKGRVVVGSGLHKWR